MTIRVSLMALAILAGWSAFADGENVALPPAFVWKTIPGLVWKTAGTAKIENGVVIAECKKVGDAYAYADIDLSEYDGRPFEVSATVKTEGIADAEASYLGYRFAVDYLDMSKDGKRVWPNGPKIVGDFGPDETVFVDRSERTRHKAVVVVGICRARGKVTCDLSTLRIREPQPLVPKRNAGYKVKYPDRVKNLPRMRGVMLGGMNEASWDNLEKWGANLVRYQIHLRGTGPATNYEAYAEGFRKNVEKELDRISAMLDQAKAHGMKVVLDAHFACGGGCSQELGDPIAQNGDWRIFHDRRFAKLFAWSWQRIAERCKGRNDVIYGYDLMNEAHHNAPALEGLDLVGLQEKIAIAIRRIDPEATIIVESMYCDPGWYRSMSAIGLDNVIYQVHLYSPHDYTHQGILYPLNTVQYWPDARRGWNREYLKKSLKPAIDFQKEHDAKFFVGEFSAIAWAPNAEGYIRDCIAVFEELGWDWTYHAYREYQGWNVECESTSRGRDRRHYRPSADNPRKRVLLQGLRGEIAPGKPAFDYRPRAFKRVVFSGNSLTRHGSVPKIGWTNDWGMAASAPEKDYVHLTVRALEAYGGARPDYRIEPLPLENGYADRNKVVARANEIAAWQPDLVVIALGENAHSVTNDANEEICRQAYLATTRIFQQAGATVILRAPFWPNDRHRRLLSKVAQETDAIYVDVGDLGWKEGMSAKGLFAHGGVAMHPGDAGMLAIADRLVTALYGRLMRDEETRQMPQQSAYEIPYAPGKELKGCLEDWADVPEAALSVPMRTSVTPCPEDLKPTFRARLTDTELQFLLTAKDSTRVFAVSEAKYRNDCFEIYLDPLYTRDVAMDATMSQTSVTPKDKDGLVMELSGPLAGATARRVEFPGGWAAEVGIPLKNRQFEMTPFDGLKFGCNVAYSNNDHPGKATTDHKLGWSSLDDTDVSWQAPAVYGEFRVKAPGKTVVVPVKAGPAKAEIEAKRGAGECCEDATLLGSHRPDPAISRGFNTGTDDATLAAAVAWGANNARVGFSFGPKADKLTLDEQIGRAVRSVTNALAAARRHGIKLVLDGRGLPGRGSFVWTYREDYTKFLAAVLRAAQPFKDALWALDIMNEPLDFNQLPYPPIEFRPFFLDTIRDLRKVDPDVWFVYDVGPGGGYYGFRNLKPLPDPHIIYALHFYDPGAFTHQGVDASLLLDAGLMPKAVEGNVRRYPGFYYGRWFDKAEIERLLKPVVEFQRKYRTPIYVGEFSCVAWAPVECTTQYLQDLVDIFEKHGWSWSYHCFRGWPGWNLDTEDGVLVNPKRGVESRRAPIIRRALEKNRMR